MLLRACVAAVVAAASYACLHQARRLQVEFPARPTLGAQLERAGRALTGNALIEPLGSAELSNRLKEQYNRAPPTGWSQFTGDIERSLALYDGFDGVAGNQWLADTASVRGGRHHRLALMLLDDRLWINSNGTLCTRYLAVELDALGRARDRDCGGRTPLYDAVDVFRSLLATGSTTGLEDGVNRDERVHSAQTFPFLAPP